MREGSERPLFITIQTTLTDEGHALLGDPGVLRDTERLLAFHTARLSIEESETRLDAFDAGGAPILSLVYGERTGAQRRVLWLDHDARTYRHLASPERLPAVPAWIVEDDDPETLAVYLANGCLLRAEGVHDVPWSADEARALWRDALWIEAQEEPAAAFWERLERFGLPRSLSLSEFESGAELTRLEVTDAGRGDAPEPIETVDYRLDEASLQPLTGTERAASTGASRAQESPPLATLVMGGAGAGSHVEWLISPELIDELQSVVNTLFAKLGKFDQLDPISRALKVDWYARAEKAFGKNGKNAFTKVREILKSFIAMSLLRGELEDGDIPQELEWPYKQWLQAIIANKTIPAGNRWCSFINGLETEKAEFGGKKPTEKEHEAYRQKTLLDIVNKVLQKRYATLEVPRPKPYQWSCWAFEFEARNFKLKIRPGSNLIKDLTVTKTGLRLDLEVDRVEVDLEYDVKPSGSAANVALCIATFGATNLAEIDSGDGTVIAKNVGLSLDVTPKRKASQIELGVTLGDASHLDVEYKLYGSNIFTYGKMEVISTILTFANAFEDDLLEEVGDQLEGFLEDFGLAFPETFNFDDAPAAVLVKERIASTPGNALRIGAQLKLPSNRAPSFSPAPGAPSCKGDFALAVDADYLNGVLTWRLDRFEKKAGLPSFDWTQYLEAKDLPSVKLPKGYEPPAKGGKYPTDYQENHETWTVSEPAIQLDSLAGHPGKEDGVGTIRIAVDYRLTRTQYSWRGSVRPPLMAPDWWWQGLSWRGPLEPDPLGPWGPGPVGPDGGPVVDLEHFLTARYGAYRQADGQVVSQPLDIFELEPEPGAGNPSGSWHAVDVGGVIVDWYSAPVSTDEHINAQLEVTCKAHLNLTKSLSFLPELDLTYSKPQVTVKKLSVSSTMSALQGKDAIFQKLVETHLKPFFGLHPFKKQFQYTYLNAYDLCGETYIPFYANASPVMLLFDVANMLDPKDNKKLWIERKGQQLKVNFRFLAGLA